MNNKEEFKSWVLNNLTDKSGAGSSYISSLDWLSNRFFEKGEITQKSILPKFKNNYLNRLYNYKQ